MTSASYSSNFTSEFKSLSAYYLQSLKRQLPIQACLSSSRMLELKDLLQKCSTNGCKALFSIFTTSEQAQPISFLVLVPSGIILVAILTLRTKKAKTPNEKKTSDKTLTKMNNTKNFVVQFPLATIHALCIVFTPLSGGWPSHLASHFQHSRVYTRSVSQPLIELDLSELLSHLTSPSDNGGIELRDPNDLSDLFEGKLSVYGWSINLRINSSFWVLAGRWIASEQLYVSHVCQFLCYAHNFLSVKSRCVSRVFSIF